MKQFVTDFEKHLFENAEKSETKIYNDIKMILEKKLERKVDLEAIFTVIDGVINYDDPEKLGVFSLYFATDFRKNFPSRFDVGTCMKLRGRFQLFVKEKCSIPERSFEAISTVYQDFFNRFSVELGGMNKSKEYAWNTNWVIFTTNYDLCLEYFWREVAKVGIDTNFNYNDIRKMDILVPRKILDYDTKNMKLIKLHGSISWLSEKGTKTVCEIAERGESYLGRHYEGEFMLYPIADKELYLDPYISMLLRLNRELTQRKVWVVIGYSFNDPIIREIFLNNSSDEKTIMLVHPEAKEVCNRRLRGIRGRLFPVNKKFGILPDESKLGEASYNQLSHQLIHLLKENPTFKWNELPI